MKYLLIALFLLATPALADSHVPCAPSEDLYEHLESKNAKRIASGLMTETIIFEIFEFPEGRWILYMTDVEGKSCRFYSGPDVRTWPSGRSS